MNVMIKEKTTQSLVFTGLFLGITLVTSCGFDDPTGPDIDGIQRQFEQETAIIDSYLEANEIEAQIDSLSEIRYFFIEEGVGVKPEITDSINVTYVGRYIDDREFDSGTATFKLNGLLTGWQLMLPQVNEGSTIEFFLPSFYGYGPTGVATIPGNTTLIFTVTLNEVIPVD